MKKVERKMERALHLLVHSRLPSAPGLSKGKDRRNELPLVLLSGDMDPSPVSATASQVHQEKGAEVDPRLWGTAQRADIPRDPLTCHDKLSTPLLCCFGNSD